MMRECTVVHKLMIASSQIRCLDKSSFWICYRGSDGLKRCVSSDHKSKDDMISLLFDLSLLGHYVSEVRVTRFFSEHRNRILLHFSKSENMRTNLKTELMEQISQILDKMKCV